MGASTVAMELFMYLIYLAHSKNSTDSNLPLYVLCDLTSYLFFSSRLPCSGKCLLSFGPESKSG
jgi:hypothetical protein